MLSHHLHVYKNFLVSIIRWENTAGSVPKNCRSDCISLPSSLFILVSIVMIYSLKFKVLCIQNECWRYSHRSTCAIHGFNCNVCPGFSRECLTWHCTEFMRVKSLHKGKCWKFITSVSPCGKIMWFTENTKKWNLNTQHPGSRSLLLYLECFLLAPCKLHSSDGPKYNPMTENTRNWKAQAKEQKGNLSSKVSA